MKNKFKVGDKVEIKSWEEMLKEFGTDGCGFIKCKRSFTTDMKHLCGRTAIIERIREDGLVFLKEWSNSDKTWWNFTTDMIKKFQFTKSDLKERWLVKLRNGEEAFYFNNELFFIKDGKFNNSTIDFDDYNEDLTCKIKEYEKHDIDEVFKPHYSKVWTREEDKPIEMTVSEIEEKLGHKVKVVADERED